MLSTTMDIASASRTLEAFFDSGKELSFPRRALILGYYDQPENAYWIASGSVKVISCNAEGVERIQHIYEKGDIFPIKWLFARALFDVAFFAQTDVRVRVKPVDDFTKFIEDRPEAMLAVVFQQFAILDRLITLHIESAEERVVFGLLSLAGRLNYVRDTHNGTVRLPLSIQDLGSMIHLSRETTGRILRKLEAEGSVSFDHHNICVYPKQLQKQLVN